jgi:hypothetical protein
LVLRQTRAEIIARASIPPVIRPTNRESEPKRKLEAKVEASRQAIAIMPVVPGSSTVVGWKGLPVAVSRHSEATGSEEVPQVGQMAAR